MDEEIRQAIEQTKEQLPVEIDLKWYHGVIKLDEVKQYIRANINSASRSFVAIGYYLKYIRDNQLYQDEGYTGISDFAKAEFGISAAQASKFMSINDRFSVDGNSPILLDRYREFSSSKLSEMLYLTEDQLDQVTLTTTKAEIRQIGKPIKEEVETVSFSPAKTEPEKVATSQQGPQKEFKPCKFGGGKCNCFTNPNICTSDIKCSSNFIEYSEEDINPYDAKKPEPGTIIYNVGGGGDVEKYKVISKYSDFSPRYFNVKDKTGTIHNISSESEHWHYTRDEAKTDSWYREKMPNSVQLVNDTPEIVDNQPETVNDVDEDNISERGCHNCKYNDMTPEEFKVIDPDGGLPCNTCDDALDQWAPKIDTVTEEPGENLCKYGDMGITISDEPQQVETVEADIIQTVPETVQGLAEQDQIFNTTLKPLIKAIERAQDAIGRGKIKDLYKQCEDIDYYISLIKKIHNAKFGIFDEEKQATEKPVQPELPILRNNDQRKEWAENYKAWGEWYYDEHIDCHYYKYDFPGGDRLIVEEYQGMIRYWNRNEKYDQAHYHLCLKQKTSQWIKTPYEQRYEHSTTSMTEIVDYLKDIQKKGA